LNAEAPDDEAAVARNPELQAMILALLEAPGSLEGRGRRGREG